jgi:hypothetical protein
LRLKLKIDLFVRKTMLSYASVTKKSRRLERVNCDNQSRYPSVMMCMQSLIAKVALELE